MKLKKMLGMMLCVTMAAAMAGCGSKDTSTDAAKETSASAENEEKTAAADGETSGKVYGVSVMTHNNSFFVAEIDGVKSAIGPNDEVMAPDPELDIQTQIDQIGDMIAAKVDVIFVDAIDSDGIKPALVAAQEAGIPVVAIDTEVTDSDLVKSTIVSDNTDAGRIAGKALCEAMGGSGKVALIDHNEVACVRDRTDGFEEILKDYPDIEIVYRQSAHGSVTESQEHTETALQGDPDITGIFAINDPTAAGSVAAIKGAGKQGIYVVSIDGSQDALDMIKAGDLLCTAAQSPQQIGATAVEIAQKIFAGESFDSQVIIPITEINADNVAEYDGKQF